MIKIEGVAYDISNFNHPGGNLSQYYGKDATDFFYAMHPSRARKTLQSLPILSKEEYVPSPYGKLYAQVIQITHRQFYDMHVKWWMMQQIMLWSILTLSWMLAPPTISVIPYSLAMVHSGWLAHHAMHHQFGPYSPLLVELMTGYSPKWWWKKHNVLHHAHTNVVDKDTDIKSGIFSFEPGKSSFPNQHIYFWPILTLMRFLWCFNGLKHGKFCFLHHLIVLSLVRLPPLQLMAWYLVGNLMAGFMLGFIVVQSHNAEEIIHDQGTDHLAHTARTTRNMPVGGLHDLCSGYLNYQIEHHLFPWLPSVYFEEIQPLVKSAMKKHNLPYTELTWTESTVKLYAYLRDVQYLT